MWTKETVCSLPSTLLEICPCFLILFFVVLFFFEHSLGLYLAPLFLSFQHALICYRSKQTNKQQNQQLKNFLSWSHVCEFVCLFVSLNLFNLCKPTILQKILHFCHNGSSSLKLYYLNNCVRLQSIHRCKHIQRIQRYLYKFHSRDNHACHLCIHQHLYRKWTWVSKTFQGPGLPLIKSVVHRIQKSEVACNEAL